MACLLLVRHSGPPPTSTQAALCTTWTGGTLLAGGKWPADTVLEAGTIGADGREVPPALRELTFWDAGKQISNSWCDGGFAIRQVLF